MDISKINGYFKDKFVFQRSTGISKINGFSKINGNFKDQGGLSIIHRYFKDQRVFKYPWVFKDQQVSQVYKVEPSTKF